MHVSDTDPGRCGAPRGALIVLFKSPAPGVTKTRLTPPCTPAQAATLAAAALQDTLAAAAATPAARRVLVIDGRPGPWCPPGFELIAQRGCGLDERLESAFADVGAPALLVGMDTPQLVPRLLTDGLRALDRDDVDAVLGPSADGGYWSVGLQRACPGAFAGVPMSRGDTGAAQRARLNSLGMRVLELPLLRDVDVIEDARAVAALAPATRFAAAMAAIA